jgi:beta-lactam-binding protein with PASTA domain
MPDVDDGDVLEADAITAITGVGLSSPSVTYVASETVEDGYVVSQSPSAGTLYSVQDVTSIEVASSEVASDYAPFEDEAAFLRYRVRKWFRAHPGVKTYRSE